MSLFVFGTVLFLVASMAVVITMLSKINLNNDSVVAWEMSNLSQVEVSSSPALVTYPHNYATNAV